MKPPMILTVTSLLSLVCAVSQASPATPPHHLEPNAPRSVTVSEVQTPPVIRAGLLQSTLILLPAEEKIATVFGGDTVDWVFDGGHVASRFISVKPKLANTTTDIHIVSDHGNEYTLQLQEISGDADAHFDSKVFIVPGDKSAKDRLIDMPVFVPAAELDKAKQEALAAKAAQAAELKSEEARAETYRSQYPGSLHFDFTWDEKKGKELGLQQIWHDDKFTYLRGQFQETPALYELKDGKGFRELYRERYSSCQGKYQLSAPFFERFFNLATPEDGAGFVGMLTSNAFMRRSFGQVVIEKFIARLDMQYIVDTPKTHIPDHGTPTVIMIGRNRAPSTQIVRLIRGIRGENHKPEVPSEAPVWRAIVDQIDRNGSESQWVSVSDVDRETLSKHPWAMGGGGAAELKADLDKVGTKLGSIVNSIGITSFTLLDEAYLMSASVAKRHRIPDRLLRQMVAGDALKDWIDHTWADVAVFPYDSDLEPLSEEDANVSLASMWTLRTSLAGGFLFGQKTKIGGGLKWFEFGRLTAWKLKSPLSISFGNVVTHNHFVLDRGGKVFNSHAPVIKLSPDSSEDEHLELLGLLNSSTACFWLKQVCHNKGGGGIGGGLATELWEQFYDLNATPINALPVPNERPLVLTRQIQREAEGFSLNLPERTCSREIPSAEGLNHARESAEGHLGSLLALQEELDWKVYELYGLVDEHYLSTSMDLPSLKKGERAFEIIMAREVESGELETEWFKRHGAEQLTELPSHWPQEYRELVERRIALIGSNRNVALIERPEYKRRWNLASWPQMVSVALKYWLLDRVEANPIWKEHRLVSCAQLRDALSLDLEWMSVSNLYVGTSIGDLESFLTELATAEAVPFLSRQRYSETGLRKHDEWENVWKLQREQDTGQTVEIQVPPKYVSKDFKKADYWRLRGGLDVSKERFITYSNLERDSDRTTVLGWAGWSHLEQARALAAYYQKTRTEEGWEPERLKPILAGLLELREWLKQWHDDVDPETGLRLGTYFCEFAEAQCQELGFSIPEVLEWQPPAGQTKTRKKSKSK